MVELIMMEKELEKVLIDARLGIARLRDSLDQIKRERHLTSSEIALQTQCERFEKTAESFVLLTDDSNKNIGV